MNRFSHNPTPEKLIYRENELIRINTVKDKLFGGGWHIHEEYEIVLITESCGTFIIGNHVDLYSKGDCFFIGPCLPHTWIPEKFEFAEAIVIHFKKELFSREFILQPEFSSLFSLFEKSSHGLLLTNHQGSNFLSLFKKLLMASGLKKVILLINILDVFCNKDNSCVLSNNENPINSFVTYNEKLIKAFNFIGKNYSKKIILKEVAAYVCMQETAFCRYFKKKTHITLFNFINEIRIGHACRLLIQTDFSVQEIYTRTGFTSLSNFLYQFKLRTNKNPSEYRNSYLKLIQ